MKKENKVNKTGFTLIELLIVVLIIGILSATALPMYRKSVEKSRVTDALTTMQAVAKSEHGWYLTNNDYTKDFANLDIDLIDENGEKANGESYDTVNYTFTLQDNAIKAERTNNEYTLYKMYEDPNIYCLPQDHYICEQFGWGVNRSLCNNINGAWSNKTGQCYNTPQERCADSETSATWQTSAGGFCGYDNQGYVEVGEFESCVMTGRPGYSGSDQTWRCQYSTFTGESSTCKGGNGSCYYSNFYNGAECLGGCYESHFYSGSSCINCGGGTFDGGSICYGNNQGTGGSCNGATFTNGSICYSNGPNACYGAKLYSGSKCMATQDNRVCNVTYYDDACCEGEYCPSNAPKCECPIGANGMHATSC